MSDIYESLLEVANETGRPFVEVVRHHLLEGVLRRLSTSTHAGDFLLRGGMLTRIWATPFPRPADDLDFLGTFPHDIEGTARRFFPALALEADDAVEFAVPACQARGIWQDSAFPGVRLFLRAEVLNRKQSFTVDVGFGDPVVPPAAPVNYPVLVGAPLPVWSVHPATMIGWKLHGLVEHGPLWRQKDLLDLWLLTARFSFPTEVLGEAIRVAFVSRGYAVSDAETTLRERSRWEASGAQARWDDWRRSTPDRPIPENLQTLVDEVIQRLETVLHFLRN